jgi:hypothetical protein
MSNNFTDAIPAKSQSEKIRREMTEKVKAHKIYKNKDGKVVPNVTSILKVLNKPALVKWANNLGLKGIDSNKYRDEKARIGTLAHLMITSELTGVVPDISDFSAYEMDTAENCVLSFYEWLKHHDLQVYFCEKSFVSEQYQYGGTLDIYGELDGQFGIVDLKTSKALYGDNLYQLAAYRNLAVENQYPVDFCKVLRIGRDEDEGSEEITKKDMDIQWEIFLHCRHLYELQKQEKRKSGGDTVKKVMEFITKGPS